VTSNTVASDVSYEDAAPISDGSSLEVVRCCVKVV